MDVSAIGSSEQAVIYHYWKMLEIRSSLERGVPNGRVSQDYWKAALVATSAGTCSI
jgi:hypothetical protein